VARVRKIPKAPPKSLRNYFLVDASFLAEKYIPLGALSQADALRTRECHVWWSEIDRQIKLECARVYVPDLCVAEAFKVLARKFYQDLIFKKHSELQSARDKLASDITLDHRELKKQKRFIRYHDLPTTRDIIISIDRFFELFYKKKCYVGVIDLILVASAKYLMDFHDADRCQIHIVTLDKTLWKGTKSISDDYYFQRPDRITSDPPPQPYVDMRREAILQRVLAKEVLRQAFAALGLFVAQGGDSVHGEFGDAADWGAPPTQPPPGAPPGLTIAQLVDAWIQNNQPAIAHTCDVLLAFTTPQMQAQQAALIAYVQTQLVPRVTVASVDPRLPQRSLSERLANVGVLPMFGFPTRIRYLFHERPGGAYDWPPDGVVDRELDIAISQFAPSSETVKDGLIHTAVGVVDYQPQGNSVVEQPTPLGPLSRSDCAGNARQSMGRRILRRRAPFAGQRLPTTSK
jgi:hypothetical protein